MLLEISSRWGVHTRECLRLVTLLFFRSNYVYPVLGWWVIIRLRLLIRLFLLTI